MISPLFSTAPVSKEEIPPVIIVGLPRSGSSFLSGILSQIENWYVFDDLYLYRKARSIGADTGYLSKSQLNDLVNMLGWQIRARIKFPKFHIPDMSLSDVDLMDQALKYTYANRLVTWHELQKEWLSRLAYHHGCEYWGYKAPQDFMHLGMLNKIYPGVKIIFIYRDPRSQMASLKNLNSDDKDGNSGQYHPIVYANYWKMAIETLERSKEKLQNRVHEVKFEALISNPLSEGKKIAKFLGSHIDTLAISRPNTSFKLGKRKGLNPTENWICEKIAGNMMHAKNYKDFLGRFRFYDLPSLTFTTCRFVSYQTIRVIKNPTARASVKSYISTMFK